MPTKTHAPRFSQRPRTPIRMDGRFGLLPLLLPLMLATAARAQILSPGALAAPHAALEGLTQCTRCHQLGSKLDPRPCLACHDLLARSIERGRGLHARPAVRGKPCQGCHPDHRGKDASLIRFDGWGDPKHFDHRLANYPLTGKHATATCEACHRARLVTDKRVRQRLGQRLGQEPRSAALATYLGLPRACDACHFDEHRHQLEGTCETCHDTKAFAPAPGFDHRKTAYPLEGAHRDVKCARCHPKANDHDSAVRNRLPPKDPASYARYARLPHERCTDCHQDVHRGKFGATCTRCHTPASWSRTTLDRRDRSFHQKTRYPLAGKHLAAPCASCHPRRKSKLITRGLKFARCADCHLDPHFGQMPLKDGAIPCERCHRVEGFFPTRYPLDDHQQTRMKLQGAHLATPCNACHPVDESFFAAKVPARLRKQSHPRGNTLMNFTRIKRPDADPKRCETCHPDPHRGQFQKEGEARACTECHDTESFTLTHFDHGKKTGYPLEGVHAKAPCLSCHAPDPARGGAVAFRGTPRACAACHGDAHGGQFDPMRTAAAGAAEAETCLPCHEAGDAHFLPSHFDHQTVGRARYPLEGRHAKVPCSACHPGAVSGARQASRPDPEARAAAWFRGVPRTCDGCHRDRHPQLARPVPGARPAGAGGPCSACHTPKRWHQVAYRRAEHQATGFPLEQGHAGHACRRCHEDLDTLDAPTRCADCHHDPHAGRLGRRCEGCHETSSFERGAGVRAHRSTRFPLTGRHALVTCEACHLRRSDRLFDAPPSTCASCHLADAEATRGTPVDHVSRGAPEACEKCHSLATWRRASLPRHELCFPIARGHHAFLRCESCHSSPAGMIVDQCTSFSASCTRCHRCDAMDRKHRGEERVEGYQCVDRKCYECHPTGGGGGD